MFGQTQRRDTRNKFQRLHDASARSRSHPDEDECGCNGSGWILSECDAYKECPYHYEGQEMPPL